ncbi:MAG: hypothetical protein LBQ76_05000 [Candidatus Fibromonas sp.]|nr:hypothetical protein [Candidatus Fibromonas sp.]
MSALFAVMFVRFAMMFACSPRYSPNMRRFVAGRCRQRPYGGGGGRNMRRGKYPCEIGKMSPQNWANTQVCPYSP